MPTGDDLYQKGKTRIRVVAARIVTAIRCVIRKEPRDRLGEDLARISSGAPHLLRDIGFVRDPRLSSPIVAIWCKGALRIAISSRDGAVSVLHR